MASSLWKLCSANLNKKIAPTLYVSVRNAHHIRGKPPGVARSLEQRLAEINREDPTLTFKVDIGLPHKQISRRKEGSVRMEVIKSIRSSDEMEKKARSKTLIIDLEDTRKEWKHTAGPQHIKRVAEHYGVFQHLFGDAYFLPNIPLDVTYENGDVSVPVYYGNVIKPSEATAAPTVQYDCEDNTLWTLIMTNPDGHFTEQDKEYVHWFVGNIPGNNLQNGETIVNYLQPFPPKGTGYHRHVLILYKQEKKLDYSKFKKEGACLNLSERTFSTLEFYKNRQEELTPAGLAFFQADWDRSLTDFYHNTLSMKEPAFEYDFPETYVKPQKWFALREAFNLYMDRYRDPKQISKEFLERKLKNVHPFKPSPKPLPFPNAVQFDGYTPSWLKLEKTKSRLKWGRVNDV